jgi:hypothetical protein
MSDINEAQPIDITGAANYQREADSKRRHRHFQVRLDDQLAAQLQHYADQRHNGVINAALMTLISKFFNAK